MFCVFCGHALARSGLFCVSCGRNQQTGNQVEQVTHETSVEELIVNYFHAGHTHAVILDLLSSVHGIHFCLRTLKNKLRNLRLYRKKNFSDLADVRRAVVCELRGPGQLFGYRTMWRVLRQKYRLTVKRIVVMRLLSALNPVGTHARRQHRLLRRAYHSLGPNYIWHVDGYDKLKPYGFALNGCIDGFSRRIMWLECGPTNSNPAVIAKYFLDCVSSIGVVPMRIRTDCGTENGTLAAIQCTLRSEHTDYYAGARSHMYGSSTSNQRIESWWSVFRKGRAQFWIELFADMLDQGLFDGSHTHQCLMRFCFMEVLQEDLGQCKLQWNLHRIRPSRFSYCPGGVPDELYQLPHRHGSRDCGFQMTDQQLLPFQEFTQVPAKCGDLVMQDFFEQAVSRNRLTVPQSWEEAMNLYINLKDLCRL